MKVLLLALVLTLSAQAKTRILALGDSLTEGYGLAKEDALPALLEKKLKAKGKAVGVIHAGISGATSASGPTMLRWHLKNKPDVLILALGANDGLRGLDVKQTEKNLTDTVATAKSHGIKVVLVGMKVPPNYG